jgi:cation/acetate symporter
MIQGVDFHWFPLDNPGIVSIPLSFALAIIVSLLTTDKTSSDNFAGVEVLGLIGRDRAVAVSVSSSTRATSADVADPDDEPEPLPTGP